MTTPSSWKKLRECAPDALPAVLAEFDSAGLFPAPGETAEQFAGRLEKLHGELSALQEGASDLQQLIAQARFPLPAAHRKAVNLTWEKYRFRAAWVPVRCDSKQTGILSAGVLLEIDRLLPIVFLHGAFADREERLGYDASESLAHEMVHAARTAFPSSVYEEYFACQVNASAFRRTIGNLFRRWELPALFFGGLAAASGLAAAGMPGWFFPLLLPAAVILRELVLRRRLARAAEHLRKAGLDALPLLLRLSDREILEIASLAPEEIKAKKESSARWKMLLEKFRLPEGN